MLNGMAQLISIFSHFLNWVPLTRVPELHTSPPNQGQKQEKDGCLVTDKLRQDWQFNFYFVM